MSLDDLISEIEETYAGLDDHEVELDEECRRELTMLAAGLDTDPDELLRRAIHLFFQSTVDTGGLDFHLRSAYDVTYDEYLIGATYEELGGSPPTAPERDDRRYHF